MTLVASPPDVQDRVYYGSANTDWGVVMTIAEFLQAEASYDDLIKILYRKTRYHVEDVFAFCGDHCITLRPIGAPRPYGPQPLRIELRDPKVRYKFWFEFT